MKKITFINRKIYKIFKKAVNRSPVVLLIGARQTGKTTLVRMFSKEKKYLYITFDELNTLYTAQNDPIGFISNLKQNTILDEVQKVPHIILLFLPRPISLLTFLFSLRDSPTAESPCLFDRRI